MKDDTITELIFSYPVNNSSKVIIANKNGQYFGRNLKFMDDITQQLECISFASCMETNIMFVDNSICNLICSEEFACYSLSKKKTQKKFFILSAKITQPLTRGHQVISL